ncbi:hypothetical protein Tco_0781679 [Tanacetum coccineum]
MQSQRKIENIGFSPCFSCYSSDSVTSKAVAKVISEEVASRFHELDDVYEDDFLFSFEGESPRDKDWLSIHNVSRSISGPLRKLITDEQSESSSYTSSEADELENIPSGTFCVWKPKTESGSSAPAMTKCKKSSSTGSGSKEKRNSGEVTRAVSRLKGQSPVHETFYVQRRAENEIVKRKSFLPHRQDLVGVFSTVNGIGKMLPF